MGKGRDRRRQLISLKKQGIVISKPAKQKKGAKNEDRNN
jgi:hypothetical protein